MHTAEDDTQKTRSQTTPALAESGMTQPRKLNWKVGAAVGIMLWAGVLQVRALTTSVLQHQKTAMLPGLLCTCPPCQCVAMTVPADSGSPLLPAPAVELDADEEGPALPGKVPRHRPGWWQQAM